MADNYQDKILGQLRAPNAISERVQGNQGLRVETGGGRILVHVRGRQEPFETDPSFFHIYNRHSRIHL